MVFESTDVKLRLQEINHLPEILRVILEGLKFELCLSSFHLANLPLQRQAQETFMGSVVCVCVCVGERERNLAKEWLF